MITTRNSSDVDQRAPAVERAPTRVAPYVWAVARIS